MVKHYYIQDYPDNFRFRLTANKEQSNQANEKKRKMLGSITGCTKLYLLHITDQTTKHLVNPVKFRSLIYVYIIHRDKLFKFEISE